MNIKQIKDELRAAPIKVLPLLIKKYSNDKRAGVRAAIISADKRLIKRDELIQKMQKMAAFDAAYGDVIIGLDEAGRGPLAGPVVTAACVIKPCDELLGLDDSKKLTEPMRNRLFDVIKSHALYYDVAIIDSHIIDDINILEATKLGMKKNLKNADIVYSAILTDYVFLENVNKPLHGITKGDQKSLCIAAASVLAKVTRDRIMVSYDAKYSGYGFAKHKGYGTKMHYEAIDKQGVSPIHRITFLKGHD